ncbi:5'-deoxyadenosine deaminase [Metallosphaera sp. J1]|uniref:amidohydrolase family protein n=1 Tax=Metallosphaera javensis (ex Hofmann et al. 2022) TaxID=99938 RepID=UPI001EE0E393|nr:amidohydrolase family protein [Metallosphaera javensis (ex Hofmann et al. 2022)]MCG3107819.1 5'-deoxyadenosine deaminase [Metallosphaera javensis (ex Hofmann et al. 2022)]
MEASSRIVNVEYALLGQELEIAEKVHVEISDGIISHVGKGWDVKGETYPNSLLMPGLVNSHVHTFDAIAPEFGWNLTLKEAVGDPHSEKYRVLVSMSLSELKKSTLNFLEKSLKLGVFTVVDFKEMDLKGATISREVKDQSPINYIPLGRLDGEVTRERLELLKKFVDGYGVSSVSVGVEKLSLIRDVFRDRITAIHVSETLRHNLLSDLEVTLSTLEPEILVHGTHLTEEEIILVAEKGMKLVVCPRSNLWFSAGIPNIPMMIKRGVRLLLGTDNAGVTDPDLWKEMEVALLLSRLRDPGSDFSREILKSVTVNPELGVYPIQEGNRITGLILGPVPRFETSINKYMALIKEPGKIIKVLGLPRT